jgi:hypothetical protein
VARESSHVVAWGSSHVEAWESSHVVARESSHVVAWGSSHVEARESSEIQGADSATLVQTVYHDGRFKPVITGNAICIDRRPEYRGGKPLVRTADVEVPEVAA